MAQTYRSIYDSTIHRPPNTRPPEPDPDQRRPRGGLWPTGRLRDDAGLPGTDDDDGESRAERLEDALKAKLSAVRRKAGLVGGPSAGGVDMAIEQKLKQSAGGAAILGALHNAWLRQNAPKWDGTFDPGSPFAHEGLASDWVGAEWGFWDKFWDKRGAWGDYFQDIGINLMLKGELTLGLAIFAAGSYLVNQALKFPDVDPLPYYSSSGDPAGQSLTFPEAEPVYEAGSFGRMAELLLPQLNARRRGEWVWGGGPDDPSGRVGGGSPDPGLLASLLGMEPNEWVWAKAGLGPVGPV